MSNTLWVKRILEISDFEVSTFEKIEKLLTISDRWIGDTALSAMVSAFIKREWIDKFDMPLYRKRELSNVLAYNLDELVLLFIRKNVLDRLTVKYDIREKEPMYEYAYRIAAKSPRWNAPLKGKVIDNGWYVYSSDSRTRTQHFDTKEAAMVYFTNNLTSGRVGYKKYAAVGYETVCGLSVDVLTNYFRDIEMWSMFDEKNDMFVNVHANSVSKKKLLQDSAYDIVEAAWEINGLDNYDNYYDFMDDNYSLEKLINMHKWRCYTPVKHYDVCSRVLEYCDGHIVYKWEREL